MKEVSLFGLQKPSLVPLRDVVVHVRLLVALIFLLFFHL